MNSDGTRLPCLLVLLLFLLQCALASPYRLTEVLAHVEQAVEALHHPSHPKHREEIDRKGPGSSVTRNQDGPLKDTALGSRSAEDHHETAGKLHHAGVESHAQFASRTDRVTHHANATADHSKSKTTKPVFRNQATNGTSQSDQFFYFPVCDYNGKKYPPGYFSPEQCVNCFCNATTGHIQCTARNCPQIANCIEYSPIQGECCPECVQKGCYHGDRVFPPGAKIDAGRCEKCYCPWEGGNDVTGAATCLPIKCPEVRCVDPVVPSDQCCPVCNNGPNCWLDGRVIAEGRRIYADKCRLCYCSRTEIIRNAAKRQATCMNLCVHG